MVPEGAPPVTVLLVRTHSPGNLGSAARAAANFGARLLLVDPRVAPGHPDIAAHASGADAVLAAAGRVDSLEEAAADLRLDHLVALTSARGRSAAGLPPATSATAVRRLAASGRPVGLVFGPERSGLTTEELLACDSRWGLPTERSFPTMNLAQAVAVALALVRGAGRRRAPDAEELPATGSAARKLFAEVRRVLEARFPDRRRRPDVVDELVSLLRRAGPTRREAELLLAALAGGRKKGA